jgi:hypothetical protein
MYGEQFKGGIKPFASQKKFFAYPLSTVTNFGHEKESPSKTSTCAEGVH